MKLPWMMKAKISAEVLLNFMVPQKKKHARAKWHETQTENICLCLRH
jgi:hypothetical protein